MKSDSYQKCNVNVNNNGNRLTRLAEEELKICVQIKIEIEDVIA
ncbi:MAG: hypothetical protein P0116_10790 [Candidatus Nitrosocosmicus sp.]|nr:hypothetical protein [Candidatus Nitrosocosmicus sp.]